MPGRSASLLMGIVAALAVVVLLQHGEIGRQAPDFVLRGAYGGEYRLDFFHGRPVLLVFWNTECGVCSYELPVVDSLYEEANHGGMEIAGVNIGDVNGAREVMRPYHMLNLVDPDGFAARSYRVGAVPKLVLIGADGTIKRSVTGLVSKSAIRGWLRH